MTVAEETRTQSTGSGMSQGGASGSPSGAPGSPASDGGKTAPSVNEKFDAEAGSEFDRAGKALSEPSGTPGQMGAEEKPEGQTAQGQEQHPVQEQGQKPPAAPTMPPEVQRAYDVVKQQTEAVNRQAEEINRVLADPIFQAAYRMAAQQHQRGGAPSGQPGQGQDGAGADVLEGFTPETENEKVLANALRNSRGETQAVLQRMEEIGGRVGRLDQFYFDNTRERIVTRIDEVGAKFKKDFPDVMDGKDNEAKVMRLATRLIAGSVQDGEPMPLDEALATAVHAVGHAGVAERERRRLMAEAGQAASAQVENPERRTGPERVDFDTQAGREFDRAFSG